MAAIAQAHSAGHNDHNSDHHHSDVDDHGGNYANHIFNARLGLWIFFLSEVFLFGGLLATRFYLWIGEHGEIIRPGLNQSIGLFVTIVLLISSYSMNMAETGMEHDDRRTFSIGMILTFVLGVFFLVGVMVFEWGLIRIPIDHPIFTEAGHIMPWDGAFGAVIFAMTGMHALHVLSGLIFIVIVWVLGLKGHYSGEEHWGVEACAIYWHYVDLVWVFFYPALYLIGSAYHGTALH